MTLPSLKLAALKYKPGCTISLKFMLQKPSIKTTPCPLEELGAWGW